jgi:hypothetical protein
MFITTTLGGLALTVSVSLTAGSILGALIRPRLDDAHQKITDSLRRVMRRGHSDAEDKSHLPS